MPNFPVQLPLALYIHIPWCVRKCPYCDFNSHESRDLIPEDLYVETLMRDLDQQILAVENRPIVSIFFGGGTPSLFTPKAIEQILNRVSQQLQFAENIE